MMGVVAIMCWIGAWQAPQERRSSMRQGGIAFTGFALLLLVLAVMLSR